MNPQIDTAIQVVRSGGLIAYPTEAVFGLGCRADDEAEVERILRLKKRPRSMGLIVLADSLEMLGDWIEPVTDEQRARLESTWPGPVTWLIPATDRCPEWLRGEHPSLAVRHSAHPVCAALVAGLGRPLVSTSANRSGQPPACTAAEVRAAFGDEIDYILDAPVGREEQPSAIFDLATGQRLR